MDCSPPGSSVRGILQARTLEWVAVPSSKRSSQPRDWIYVSYSWEVGSLPLASPGKPNNLPKVIPKKKENTETQSWGILVCLSSSPSTSTALGSVMSMEQEACQSVAESPKPRSTGKLKRSSMKICLNEFFFTSKARVILLYLTCG